MTGGDRPDARELVEAVALWLAEELSPALEGGARFQALVAAQALAIAGREMELSAGHDEADVAALGSLTAVGPDATPEDVRRALAEELRSGVHDAELSAVAEVLREHVVRKIAVARPGYDNA